MLISTWMIKDIINLLDIIFMFLSYKIMSVWILYHV